MSFGFSAFSGKSDTLGLRGIFHEASSEKTREDHAQISEMFSMQKSCRDPYPKTKSIISDSYKVGGRMQMRSVKIITHIVGNKFLFIGNNLYTFSNANFPFPSHQKGLSYL
jgi:hypothetical protein